MEDKEILHGIDLEIQKGETHVLMGPNGAGKSTLGYALMGNPRYEATAGNVLFQGKRINEESADKRARDGMFLSFQNPLEIPGLTLGAFIRGAVEQRRGERVKLSAFRKEMGQAMELLQMDRAYGDRDLNVGFSGGEKKKAEILQMLLLKPSLAILDETDSVSYTHLRWRARPWLRRIWRRLSALRRNVPRRRFSSWRPAPA